MESFDFAFDPRYRRVLWALGVTPARSWVKIGHGSLEIHFGPWRFRTRVANVRCCEVTGPYRAHRAIGPHISLVDRGLSFGSTTDRGLCMRFHEPVRGRETFGLVHHPGLTVTVADVDGLATAIGRAQDAAGTAEGDRV